MHIYDGDHKVKHEFSLIINDFQYVFTDEMTVYEMVSESPVNPTTSALNSALHSYMS